MIPARKNAAFNRWFAGHARSRIQDTFDRVCVQGLGAVVERARTAPLLVVSNHTSWWDPLVSLHVSQHLVGADGHALMDAKNLRRLPFFGLVGAFGVDLGEAADGARAVRYAARLLDAPGRLVWVFPQGTERPVTERPLGFRRGSAEIARIAKRALTTPVGIRYEFGGAEKPALYLSFGDVVPADRDTTRGLAAQEAAVEHELARIEGAVRGDSSSFVDVFRAPSSTRDELATRALAALTVLGLGSSR